MSELTKERRSAPAAEIHRPIEYPQGRPSIPACIDPLELILAGNSQSTPVTLDIDLDTHPLIPQGYHYKRGNDPTNKPAGDSDGDIFLGHLILLWLHEYPRR